MANNQKIEVFGNLTKIETVNPVEDNVAAGIQAFESLNPFPGYYHERPDTTCPFYIYLVLSDPTPLERILRATQNIERDYGWHFDAGKGYMEIGMQELHVIRLRHVPNLGIVKEIIEAYEKQGIIFRRKNRKTEQQTVRVKIVKFLSLEKLADNIYLDLKEKNHGYFKLPHYIDRDKFLKVARDVRYNWEGHEFDAAVGSFYQDGKLHEIIRVYSNQLTTEYLQEIRELYLKKIK